MRSKRAAGGAVKSKRKLEGNERSELPAVQRTYDLLAWLLPQIERFPLGARILDCKSFLQVKPR